MDFKMQLITRNLCLLTSFTRPQQTQTYELIHSRSRSCQMVKS